MSYKQCSPRQATCQQRDNEGKGCGHVVPTPIHQLVQQLHLLAGTLQLGDMLQATGGGQKLVTKERSRPPISATKPFLREMLEDR